jgi:lipoprotein-releasing system ATP-binding protein
VPDRGELRCAGWIRGRGDRLTLRRHHLGFVFQLHNLIPDLTVEENLRVPALAIGARPWRETAARIRNWRTQVGIGTGSATASRIFRAASGSAPRSAGR